ncbi:MAG: SDR family NAD(P)-dependent oxidoreductase, partial [Gammaproteobacteria bacterium]
MQADIFTNKTVLITGAASGIGRGLALHAAKLQMNVVLMDLNKNGLSETHSLMVDCPSMIIQCDVSNLEDFAKAKEQIESEFGTVHFLFNNAGIFLEGRAWKADQKNWQRIIDVNLMSVIYGLNLFVDEMVASQERCHIINTSSMAGIIVGPALAPYTTTKHAVVGLTRTLHEDLADNDKVGVSLLCPGLVQTNIIERDHLGLDLDESSIDQHESAKNNAQWLADGVKEGMSPEDLA